MIKWGGQDGLGLCTLQPGDMAESGVGGGGAFKARTSLSPIPLPLLPIIHIYPAWPALPPGCSRFAGRD